MQILKEQGTNQNRFVPCFVSDIAVSINIKEKIDHSKNDFGLREAQ